MQTTLEIPKLSQKAINAILESHELQGLLAGKLKRNPRTIQRMADRNDLLLTHPVALAVLIAESKLPESEILETDKKPS